MRVMLEVISQSSELLQENSESKLKCRACSPNRPDIQENVKRKSKT